MALLCHLARNLTSSLLQGSHPCNKCPWTSLWIKVSSNSLVISQVKIYCVLLDFAKICPTVTLPHQNLDPVRCISPLNVHACMHAKGHASFIVSQMLSLKQCTLWCVHLLAVTCSLCMHCLRGRWDKRLMPSSFVKQGFSPNIPTLFRNPQGMHTGGDKDYL